LLAVRGTDASAQIGRLKVILEEQAARSPDAARMRGRLGLDGLFGAEDPVKSREWLEQAANKGDLPAMRELSTLYIFGLGVAPSEQKAFEWLLKAAEAGDARAAYDVAQAFERGLGTKTDPEKAAFWRNKVPVKSNPPANDASKGNGTKTP
jgi:TPR repeat protein